MDLTRSSIVRYGSVEVEVIHDANVTLTMDNIGTDGYLSTVSARNLFNWTEPLDCLPLDVSMGQPIQEGLIPFEVFERIVLWQADEGNPNAKAILAASFRSAFRSISVEQVTGAPVPLADRLRKIDEDRNQFYQQYAAGISDQEWLEGNAIGFMGTIDMSQTSHWAAFSNGFVPQFLTAAIARGEDPDMVMEEMRIKYEAQQ